jgi:3-deoxy-D-manno-octulosonate 8-phosphate phosphatase (KDO 8-P phosphatase)
VKSETEARSKKTEARIKKLMRKTKTSIQSKIKKIKLLLLDVDGVMTDGRIILDNQGNELKAFHVRDGHGIKLAQRAGIMVGIITGRKSEVVNIRARELGIQEVHQGALDKITVYETLISKYGLKDDEVAYMGDDIVDLGIFDRAGVAATVADPDPAVKPHVDLIMKAAGGRGAVREFINLILKNREKPRAT